MTLFNDEEIEDEKKERTRFRIWTRRIIYTALILGIMFWISLRLLMTLGGDAEPLQKGFEQVLQDVTGLRAKIDKFNYMKFYPDVGVDAEKITLSLPSKDPDAGTAVATVEELKLTVDFWAVFFSRKEIEELTIKNIDLMKDVYLRESVHVDEVVLKKENAGQAAMVASGRFAGNPFNASVGMTWAQEKGGKVYFSWPDKGPVSFGSSFLTIQGVKLDQASGGIKLSLDSIGFPEKMLSGDVTIERDGNDYSLSAALKGGRSEFVINLNRTRGIYKGSLHMPVFDTEDVKILRSVYNLYNLLAPGAQVWESGAEFKADLEVRVDVLKIKGTKAGNFSFPVHAEGGILTVGPLKGDISGGQPSGQLTLDGSKKTVSLAAKMMIRDIHYGPLQKALFSRDSASGKATLELSLAGEAAAAKDLVRNLKGEAALVAGGGDLMAQMLDPWGKDLIDLMLPGFEKSGTMSLNCLIADFRFAEGVAKTDPLFLDSDRLTISGTGEITLSADPQINIGLRPGIRDTALSGTGVNVRIKGPLADPLISRDAPGKKSAGTPPDIINPAFLSFSLTDLGLVDGHPCHAFVGKAAP